MRKCIIIPYYGDWPSYLNLFLEGCKVNAEVDILFFTDLNPPLIKPSNVFFYYLTIRELELLIAKQTNLKVALKNPYKLCDFKPVYGKIFSEYLVDYDFWGFGDIDVYFGKFSNFDLNQLFREKDILSFRKKWISGSLSFVRNNSDTNILYQKAENFEAILLDKNHLEFDEIGKAWDEIRTKSIENIKFENDNFTNVVFKEAKRNALNIYREDLIKESINSSEYIKIDKGRVFDQAGKEYLYYHYITEKKNPFFSYPNWVLIPKTFYITKYGFFTEKEFKNRKLLSFIRCIKKVPYYLLYLLQRIKLKLIKFSN